MEENYNEGYKEENDLKCQISKFSNCYLIGS